MNLRKGTPPAGMTRRHTGRKKPSVPSFPTRLLIDFPNWLGDLAMALPATNRLMKANVGGRTIFHCRPSTARLLQSLYPDATIVVSERKESARDSSGRIRRKAGSLDLGLSFRNAFRAKSLLKKCCTWTAGTADQAGWAMLDGSFRVDLSRHQLHDTDPLLNFLGLDETELGWATSLPAQLIEEGESLLSKSGLHDSLPRIALAPGVALGGSAKQWAPEKMGHLAARLQARSFHPFIAIGPGEMELGRRISRETPGSLPLLGEKLDAAGLASLLYASDAVIGNDSGPSHLAAILGVPVLTLFGPTDPERTAPIGTRVRVLNLNLPCAPCNERKCPEGHGHCMKNLDVDMVHQALEELLDSGLKRQRAIH